MEDERSCSAGFRLRGQRSILINKGLGTQISILLFVRASGKACTFEGCGPPKLRPSCDFSLIEACCLQREQENINNDQGRDAVVGNPPDGSQELDPRTLAPTLAECSRGSGTTSPCEVQENDGDPGRNGGGDGQGVAPVEELVSGIL